MDPALAVPVALVAGYLLGSVDFAVWVARSRGVDIYAVGSGNPGTSNVARTLGKGAAAVVLVGDLMKGLIAAAIGFMVSPEPTEGLVTGFGLAGLAGVAAVLGHCFPVLHKFKGGKGVATGFGVLLYLQPLLALALGAVWGILVAVTKTASIGSLVALIAVLPAFWIWGPSAASFVWVAAIVVLVVARHAPNIRRLVGREESTITKDEA
jgi:acyl phosphate:glycerol-3-phosphate acyltransferase